MPDGCAHLFCCLPGVRGNGVLADTRLSIFSQPALRYIPSQAPLHPPSLLTINNCVSQLPNSTWDTNIHASSKRSACSVVSVLSDSLRPHGLESTRLLCPWDSPSKNTRVGCHALLQGIFPTQVSNPRFLHLPCITGRFLTHRAIWEAPSKKSRVLQNFQHRWMYSTTTPIQ